MAEKTLRNIYQSLKKFLKKPKVEIGLSKKHPTGKAIAEREEEYARYEKELGLPPSKRKKLKAR